MADETPTTETTTPEPNLDGVSSDINDIMGFAQDAPGEDALQVTPADDTTEPPADHLEGDTPTEPAATETPPDETVQDDPPADPPTDTPAEPEKPAEKPAAAKPEPAQTDDGLAIDTAIQTATGEYRSAEAELTAAKAERTKAREAVRKAADAFDKADALATLDEANEKIEAAQEKMAAAHAKYSDAVGKQQQYRESANARWFGNFATANKVDAKEARSEFDRLVSVYTAKYPGIDVAALAVEKLTDWAKTKAATPAAPATPPAAPKRPVVVRPVTPGGAKVTAPAKPATSSEPLSYHERVARGEYDLSAATGFLGNSE